MRGEGIQAGFSLQVWLRIKAEDTRKRTKRGENPLWRVGSGTHSLDSVPAMLKACHDLK